MLLRGATDGAVEIYRAYLGTIEVVLRESRRGLRETQESAKPVVMLLAAPASPPRLPESRNSRVGVRLEVRDASR